MKPTLFIGLGTTGLTILKSLRQLMFEEYGPEGLPIFRYVSIETDAAADVEDNVGLTDKINIVRATIPATKPIENKLNPNHPNYDEHLKKWLNPSLLQYAASFMAGASNIRMAGRLCLWENWAAVVGAITNAWGAAIGPAAIGAAGKILIKHYAAKKQPVPDGGPINAADGVNVYIVGSLCGGSCSGMMLDVAYFCGHNLGGVGAGKVYGIFTMFDAGQAGLGDNAVAVRSANCFGALSELNYYHHPNTTYDIKFPSGQVVNTIKLPFDYTALVSRTSKSPTNKKTHVFMKDGLFDESGFNLMVALNLFADTAGDTDGQKAQILTDGVGVAGFGGLKDVIAGQIPTMVKAFASFGLTAVWYPKYRIASAAAASISQTLCQNWLGTHVGRAKILADAGKDANAILTDNINVFEQPDGQPSIRLEITNHLNKFDIESRKGPDADALKDMMVNFPNDTGSFTTKLAPGGQYYELMKLQVPVCKRAFCKDIDNTLNSQLNKINRDKYGLGDIQSFFEALDKEIQKTIRQLPANLSTLPLDRLNTAPIAAAENNLWTKLIFLQDESIKAQRQSVVEAYKKLIIGDKNSLYQSVRNYLLRDVLVGVQNHLAVVKQRLDRIEQNLENCLATFKGDYADAINPPTTSAVMIVTNNKDGIAGDADALASVVLKLAPLPALLKGQTVDMFLGQTNKNIQTQMTETYRRLSLDAIPVKDVVKQVQKILADGNNNAKAGIETLANRSNAYQQFIDGYTPFAFAPPLHIISGHDPNAGQPSLSGLQSKFKDAGGNSEFPRKGNTAVDHLLFFYKAESGFALDDLAAYTILKNKFSGVPGKYGHLTHQDPDFYDLELYHKTEKLQRWCRALGKLVPEIHLHLNKNAFTAIFHADPNYAYIFEYDVDDIPHRLGLLNNPKGIERLSKKKNEIAYNAFFQAVQKCFTKLDRQKIKERVKVLLRGVKDINAHARLGKFYTQFLKEVYPDGDAGGAPNGDAKSEWDDHFSDVPDADAPRQDPPNVLRHVESGYTAETAVDSYAENHSDETEHKAGSHSTATAEHNTENPHLHNNTDDTNGDGWAWTETEAESESTDEPAPEEIPPVQEAQPQTDVPDQGEKSSEFSVANADVEQLIHRGNTRKKE